MSSKTIYAQKYVHLFKYSKYYLNKTLLSIHKIPLVIFYDGAPGIIQGDHSDAFSQHFARITSVL